MALEAAMVITSMVEVEDMASARRKPRFSFRDSLGLSIYLHLPALLLSSIMQQPPALAGEAGSLQRIGGTRAGNEGQYCSGMHLGGLLYEDFVGGASAAMVELDRWMMHLELILPWWSCSVFGDS